MTSDAYLLPHQERLIQEVELARTEVEVGGNSHGILCIGPSGSGKTHGLDRLAERYPPSVDGVQRLTPMVRVQVPVAADSAALIAAILTQLGKPVFRSEGRGRPAKGQSVRTLEPDLFAALVAHKVVILGLEEGHNALLAGTKALRGQVNRLIKNIWNGHPQEHTTHWAHPQADRGDWRLVFVISGTDELLPIFKNDPELSSRFPTLIRTAAPDIYPPESLRAYRSVFRTLCGRYGLSESASANDDRLVLGTLLASNGHLRRLEVLLKRAATLLRRDGPSADLRLALTKAFEQVAGIGSCPKNPFLLTEQEMRVLAANRAEDIKRALR